jgi:hypothetical protein
MRVFTEDLIIPKKTLLLHGLTGLRDVCHDFVSERFDPHRPIRFVVTGANKDGYLCEVDLLAGKTNYSVTRNEHTIFDFRKRTYESTEKFVAVLLIPTGIGAELGGHCGDGNALSRLLAGACDTLITHPNVVNASDINEITENTLYVEGSFITRLLMGQIGLQQVRSNRVLMLMDRHDEKFFNDEVVNAVSSARISLGLECDVHELENKVESVSRYSSSGRAVGEVNNLEELFGVIDRHRTEYNAIALSTFIKVPSHFHADYFARDDMINPWGGIEAMLTHSIAECFNIPCAHSPMMTSSAIYDLELGIVDPRKAPESASVTYLHCILKGLHRSPQVVAADKGITLENISCLVIPDGCVGLPTLACLENGIPVIAVKENRNTMKNELRELPFKRGKLFVVENYLEAVGVIISLRQGVSVASVRRPISPTKLV